MSYHNITRGCGSLGCGLAGIGRVGLGASGAARATIIEYGIGLMRIGYTFEVR